jgi:hypothetical protein
MRKLTIAAQPDGVSCGPSCLHALYHYFDDYIALEQTIQEVRYLPSGGTLAVLLGCHALRRGYRATLHSVNLQVLDPSWLQGNSRELLVDKLRIQVQRSRVEKVQLASEAYLEFLSLGGEITFGDISFALLCRYLDEKLPILSGLSATYLYQNMRDYTSADKQVVNDEWRGEPSGHFVVLRGYAARTQVLHIADPFSPQPLATEPYYSLPFSRWLHAHLLGTITFDAEFLVIAPQR